MTPQTAVMSHLLCDLDGAPAPVLEQVGGPLLRALGLVKPRSVSADFQATVDAHLIETDIDVWFASVDTAGA